MIFDFGLLVSAFEIGLRQAMLAAIGRPPMVNLKNRGTAAYLICHALAVRWLLTVINGVVLLHGAERGYFTLFALIALVDTLLYPVASHAVMQRMGCGNRWPGFIMLLTWVNNLRIMLLFAVGMLSIIIPGLEVLILGFVLWMLWTAWRAATISLGRGGWAGGGMILLSVLLEVGLGVIVLGLVITPRLG